MVTEEPWKQQVTLTSYLTLHETVDIWLIMFSLLSLMNIQNGLGV